MFFSACEWGNVVDVVDPTWDIFGPSGEEGRKIFLAKRE